MLRRRIDRVERMETTYLLARRDELFWLACVNAALWIIHGMTVWDMLECEVDHVSHLMQSRDTIDYAKRIFDCPEATMLAAKVTARATGVWKEGGDRKTARPQLERMLVEVEELVRAHEANV